MTQIEMAKFLGIANATWQKIERNEGVPAGETLLLFERLGVNPGWVLSGLGPKAIAKWRNPDAEDELFMRICAMVKDIHERAGIDMPDRGIAKTARAIFTDVIQALDANAGPDEIDGALQIQAGRLRRRLAEASAEPGTGKLSAS